MENKHLVSLIVLAAYIPDQKYLTSIKSFLSQDYPDYEIIIVFYNATHNFDHTNYFHQHQIDTKRISLWGGKSNLGYTRGNNLGVKKAKGDLILIINPDVEVKPDFISKLVISYDNLVKINKTEKIIVGPRICNKTGVVEYATRNVNFLGFSNMHNYKTTKTLKTLISSGCAFLISRKNWDQLGAFDETYWMYHDDVEISVRANYSGYLQFVDNSIPLWHLKTDEEYKLSKFKYYWHERNRLKFCFENSSNLNRMVLCQSLLEPFHLVYALMHKTLLTRFKIYKYLIQNKDHIINHPRKSSYEYEKIGEMMGIYNEVGKDSLVYKFLVYYVRILYFLYNYKFNR